MMQCPICGATASKNGKQIETQGQLNLHMYHYHRDVKNQPDENEKQGKGGCNHDWRLLNPHDQDEQRAMNDNYGEVCTKCQELR